MLDLTPIKERCKKATSKPWHTGWLWDVDEWHKAELKVGLTVGATYRGGICLINLREDGQDNAAFIAHAREDIPALIAEVERLRIALQWIKDDALLAIEEQSAK